ncbi:MAG: antibiotic biosynthesis monooxygenase [Deinococcus sp.]|uniref:antibiotic biosynthesis monooxygenase n=1 Tax=Deinococcus sp. TaxID=47478 RepID=UPI0026DB9AC0|nr:antibiotic biosynthesis monooxygenase [Deinococcus sp.]MDO4246138.1 antibiotic biosynthesis monooxygenase [Deinococcus sp.]
MTQVQTDPVSLVIRRRIRPGKEAEYEVLLAEGIAMLARMPGHRGTGIVRPATGDREYTLMARFDDVDSAAAWEQSPERLAWLRRMDAVVDEHVSFERQPGLDFWFTPPAAPTLRQPPRWKMALLTLGVLYPVSLGLNWLLGPHLGHWPLPPRVLVQSLLVVVLMTYLFMPLATRAAAGWLSEG